MSLVHTLQLTLKEAGICSSSATLTCFSTSQFYVPEKSSECPPPPPHHPITPRLSPHQPPNSGQGMHDMSPVTAGTEIFYLHTGGQFILHAFLLRWCVLHYSSFLLSLSLLRCVSKQDKEIRQGQRSTRGQTGMCGFGLNVNLMTAEPDLFKEDVWRR